MHGHDSTLMVICFAAALTAAPPSAHGQYEPGQYWNAPDRAELVMRIRPGARTPDYSPETLLADWTARQVARWEQEHADWEAAAAAEQYAHTEPTDADLQTDFPRHVAPFARVRSGDVDAGTRQDAMFSYCPFCRSRTMSLTFDSDNPYGHATTNCCGAHLYADEGDHPDGYALPATETVRFRHLDDSWYEAKCAVYEDADGVVWELFIPTIFAHKRWIDQGCGLVERYGKEFEKTADPFYAHKIAVILDMAADTYYGLPLCYRNEIAGGRDGEGLTRAEWESVERPAIFEVGELGPWNRRTPIGNRGWLNMLDEHIWVEPFALVRHHPAFRHYSQQTYGNPDALDRKVREKLLRELSLMFQSVFAQKLLHNYQEANYADMWLLGMLTPDQVLIDFAGPCQELSMYNHTHQDGMNGQGAPNYMHMPGGYYYPFLADPDGWLRYQPDFLQQNPFYHAASSEMYRTRTVRGLYLEFGDQHQYAFDGRFITDPAIVRERERIGSRNWPGYGTGILRVGGPEHRMEVSLHDSRANMHTSRDALSMECWVDGVPVLRKGGYAAHWHNVPIDWDRPEYQALREMDYPHEIIPCERGFASWSWVWSHSAQCQNAAMVNETATGGGWGDNRGYGECVTFKGGEEAGAPGSGFQVLDVRDHYSFARVGQPVTDFRRTMIGVEGPDGRPYVLDLLRLAGGGRHALYSTAVAERVGENMPTTVGTAAHLGEVLLGDEYDETEPEDRNFGLITSVERLAAPGRTWDLTWATDYAAYAPRDPNGAELERPLAEGVGDVRLRMLGVTDTDGETELLRAKAPWVTWIRQPVPGHHVNGNVAFKDARDMLVESRTAIDDGDLDSLFAHVLEGYRAGEQSAIEALRPLEITRQDDAEGPAVALALEMAGGHTDTVLYQAQAGEVTLPDGTQTDARYALVRRDAEGDVMQVDACRGTFLRTDAFEAEMPGDFTGTIVDVIGDLTGTRQESALIIRPDAPWPVGENLRDRQLLVRVESDLRDPCNEGYRIASIEAVPDGLVRVNVQDHAPFAESWHEVTVLPEDRPNTIRTWRPMQDHANTPWYGGTYLWFPEHGKTFEIDHVNERGGGFGGETVTLQDDVNLAAEGIEVGDWYVIHAIRPGLQVAVPNDLCWRREPAGEWQQHALRATGDVTVRAAGLTEPGIHRLGDGSWQEAPEGRASFPGAEMGERGAEIIVGKPDWLSLDDDAAPVVERIALDGEQITAEAAADLGWIEPPQTAQFVFRDAANPIDATSLQVLLDGQQIGDSALSVREEEGGRALDVEVALSAAQTDAARPQRHRIVVTVADRSIRRFEAEARMAWIGRVPLDEDTLYLSDLQEVRSFAHGGLILDRDYGGELSEIGDRVYPKSVMICPEPGAQGTFGEVVYELPQEVRRATLLADIGIENMTGGRGSAVFMVQTGESADGPWRMVYESPVMRGGQPPRSIEVGIDGAAFLRLYTTDAGDGINSDHALWGNVRLK